MRVFTEASTIPLAALTSAFALYQRLGLPSPWTPATEPTPLVIWGAASALGTFAIHLAKRSNLHPIIGVAGDSLAYAESLLDKSRGDVVVDYRAGPDAVVAAIRKAAGDQFGDKLLHAYDTICAQGSTETLDRVLAPGARLTGIAPGQKFEGDGTKAVEFSTTSVGNAFNDEAGKDLAFVYSRAFGRGLQEGWFHGHPQVVVPGGLGGVQQALVDLKAGKAHGFKYVFRIADTEGLSQ